MSNFLSAGVVFAFLIVLLLLAPFLTIWSINTLFDLGISHGLWEYLAVWALLVIWKPVDHTKKKK